MNHMDKLKDVLNESQVPSNTNLQELKNIVGQV